MKYCRIYILKDPITGEAKYVGRTISPLSSRLVSHKSQKNNFEKDLWLKGLNEQGKEPIIIAIETVDISKGAERELHWINYLEQQGASLLNACKPRNLVVAKERPNGGRKPADDPKVCLTIYVRKSRIDAIGIDNIKGIAINLIEKEYKKKK